MGHLVNPTVRDFESDENAAGAQDTEHFGEHLILEFCGLEMVQDKDGEDGGEGVAGEGQMGGVTADGSTEKRIVMQLEFEGGVVVVVE
jgi:hypothetical protein